MPEKTCSNCQCNKVCDHNKYGFENCGNYISADVAPRAEVAREIFEAIEKFNRKPLPECQPVYIIKEREIAELKKKYTED